MFKLLKWLLIIFILGSAWYLVDLIWSMEKVERQQIKAGALEAIDTGDVDVLAAPLGERVKQDLVEKKASFIEQLKITLKRLVTRIFDAE